MIESGLTRSLVVKLPRHFLLAVREFRAQTKNTTDEAMDGCVLMPDVVVPEAHQNDCSYVCELSGPTFDSV